MQGKNNTASAAMPACPSFTVLPVMAFVPFQSWEQPYELKIGLNRGTIFPSLDKPFVGKGASTNE